MHNGLMISFNFNCSNLLKNDYLIDYLGDTLRLIGISHCRGKYFSLQRYQNY